MEDKYSIKLPLLKKLPSSPDGMVFSPKGMIIRLIEINEFSILRFRKYLERFAYYFKKEFKYDFVGYEASEGQYSYAPPYKGYLFIQDAVDQDVGVERVFGACLFRYLTYRNAPPSWCLMWIWLHPFFRRQGILSVIWPAFKNEFGDFKNQKPLSLAMELFLKKNQPNSEKD